MTALVWSKNKTVVMFATCLLIFLYQFCNFWLIDNTIKVCSIGLTKKIEVRRICNAYLD